MSNFKVRKSYWKILFYLLKRPHLGDRFDLRCWLNSCSDDARRVTEFYVKQNRKEIRRFDGSVISPGLVEAIKRNFKLEHGYAPCECRKCGCLTGESEKYCSVCGTRVYSNEDLKLLYSLPNHGNFLRFDRQLHKYDNLKQDYIQELENKYKETHGHAPNMSNKCRNCDYELKGTDKYCQCCGTKVETDRESEKIRFLYKMLERRLEREIMSMSILYGPPPEGL